MPGIPVAQLALDYAALNGCGDLDAWMKAKKTISATLELRHITADTGISAPVDVAVEGYKAACGFRAYIELRRGGRYYLVFEMKYGAMRQKFFLIGAKHLNNPQPPYQDVCCGSQIDHLKPYEKRRAHLCTKSWGRRAKTGISHATSVDFLEDAAKLVNLTLPSNPLVETFPQQPVLGGP